MMGWSVDNFLQRVVGDHIRIMNLERWLEYNHNIMF